MIEIIIVTWIICSIITYGYAFAYLQAKNPNQKWVESCYKMDMVVSIAYSMLGPIGLVIFLIINIFDKDMLRHGFRLW